VYDQDGQALNWSVRQLELDLDANQYAQEQESGVNFHMEIDVPKSGVSLRSGVYDWTSNLAGTLELPFNKLQNGQAPRLASK
jgi:hypothetical protein